VNTVLPLAHATVRLRFVRKAGENTVNRHITVGLAMLASAALGAAAIQTLHAQAKPPAYNIVEITIKDQDGYTKEYLPVITKVLTDAAGKFLVRGSKTISYEGAAPAPRVDFAGFSGVWADSGHGYAAAPTSCAA
jgi:hypothetical protein